MPKHLEKKQTAKPFLISTQNIQNGYKKYPIQPSTTNKKNPLNQERFWSSLKRIEIFEARIRPETSLLMKS